MLELLGPWGMVNPGTCRWEGSVCICFFEFCLVLCVLLRKVRRRQLPEDGIRFSPLVSVVRLAWSDGVWMSVSGGSRRIRSGIVFGGSAQIRSSVIYVHAASGWILPIYISLHQRWLLFWCAGPI